MSAADDGTIARYQQYFKPVCFGIAILSLAVVISHRENAADKVIWPVALICIASPVGVCHD